MITEELEITEDMFSRSRMNATYATAWDLSGDGQTIYFPHTNSGCYYSEQVLEISDTSLTLYRLNRHHLRDSLAITYEKVENY